MMREPTVASVMTTKVITVAPETPFKDVVTLLTTNDISAVPVIGPHGTVIGVVSEADVLPKQEFHGGADPLPHGVARRRRRWYRSLGLCAAELMTTPVLTIGPDASITLAARRLAENRVRRLFVVDTDGRLVGVLSRRDLLGMFLRSDEDILADIQEHVFDPPLGPSPEPSPVSVTVADGVVTLDGEVERRSDTGMFVYLIQAAVPGVISVRSNLRYRVDDLAPTSNWTGFSP
jgi:CBS domain-containing protein